MTAELSHDHDTEPTDPMLSEKLRCLTTIAIAGGFLILLFRNPSIPSAIRLLFAVALLLGLVRSSAAILLVLVQCDLALSEVELPFSGNLVLNGVTTLLTVVVLMAVCRLRSAQELTGSLSVRGLLRVVMGESPGPVDHRAASAGAEGITIFTWLWTLGLMSVSALILVLFPEQSRSVMDYGLTPAGLRCVQVGLVLVIWYAVLTIPLSELWWRRMTADQASMYLRSLFLGWSHRDFRMVVRRQVRRRRKALRRRKSAMAAWPVSQAEKTSSKENV